MARFRLRLIACLTLVSYLGTGIPIPLLAGTKSVDQPGRVIGALPDEPVSCPQEEDCCPCDSCPEVETSAPFDSPPPSPAWDHPEEEQEPAPCPCCPKGPGGKPCPLPGGCAYCNVAKVPCLDEMPLCQEAPVCLDEAGLDLPFLYTPPPASGLIRPPKI